MLCFLGCEIIVLLKELSPASISSRHSVMFVAESEFSNETRERFVGFARIVVSDIFNAIERSSG